MVAASIAVLGVLAVPGSAGTLATPIDPAQYTWVGWGKRSHWLQPWRAYLDTWPAQRLLDSVGINYNMGPAFAVPTARLLAASGFERARFEVGWGSVTYEDETKLTPNGHENLVVKLEALMSNGIRPLIVLNSHDSFPVPGKKLTVTVTADAPAGARELKLDAASLGQVVLDRTGLNAYWGETRAAAIFFTAVDTAKGTVTLSKPLPKPLAAGAYGATTLAYGPFPGPKLASGGANPKFQETMNGWLRYVTTVAQTVEQIMGSEAFDVEIWNEVTFGADFLDLSKYYNPLPAWAGTGNPANEILVQTVAHLRNPANGTPTIGIGNGFANQRPWDAGSTSPVGLTAIDKHPYPGLTRYPAESAPTGTRPVNALGKTDGTLNKTLGVWTDKWIPTYDAFFPEHPLTALRTETLLRDIAPFETLIMKVLHGRSTAPPGGTPPTMWVTETNMNANRAEPTLTADQLERAQAKIILRTLVSYVNKGVAAVYFYAADAGAMGLVKQSFYQSLAAGSDPGNGAGGLTMDSMRRLTSAFAGATNDPVKPLTLVTVTDNHDRFQFAGDGTAGRPPLYNRNVVTFLPFQVSAKKYVVPTYVMTRNVVRNWNPALPADAVDRYDLPEEAYTLTIGGLPGVWQFGLYDPLTDTTAPVTVVSRSGDRSTITLPLTDSPRLLTISQ